MCADTWPITAHLRVLAQLRRRLAAGLGGGGGYGEGAAADLDPDGLAVGDPLVALDRVPGRAAPHALAVVRHVPVVIQTINGQLANKW